ncbi:endogenous retrovirus group K member 19 Pro protein-like [Talpa occidentalis]|uniref:endogenous retrovirus group K member 19 Pro protein-like n=1 Tax=Talpa occidentalis TaxID=50954 RepID=UPI00189087D6|nr:endogenous retrovirus group K member 19 Pro protein-like [Talpa occidentalis]
MALKIQGKDFIGLRDMGADTSIIAFKHWPSSWPLQEVHTTLQGLGSTKNPQRSSAVLSWTHEEGHSGQFQPYVLPNIPMNLWGKDVLSAMGALLVVGSQVTQMMINSGYTLGKGLGKSEQGPTSFDLHSNVRADGDR